MLPWSVWITREEIEDMIKKKKSFKHHPAWKLFFSQFPAEEIMTVSPIVENVLNDIDEVISLIYEYNPRLQGLFDDDEGREWLKRQVAEFKKELEKRGYLA